MIHSLEWLNLGHYPAFAMYAMLVGCLLRFFYYGAVIRGIVRDKVVEIPTTAVVAHLAWESAWGFVFTTDLGTGFTWIYRAWFVIDLFVLAALLRFGKQHINNLALRPIYELAVLGGYVAWIMMLVLFVLRGDDTANGMVSWLVAMSVTSSLYAVGHLRKMRASQYSVPAAMFKLAGNLCTLLFCVMAMRDMGLVITLSLTVVVLDVAYVALMLDRRKRERAGLPMGAPPDRALP